MEIDLLSVEANMTRKARPAEIGDNSNGQLRAFVERIENISEEIIALGDYRKEIYAEAKGQVFDTKIIRKVIRLRKQDTAKRQEEEALVDLYIAAIGGL